MNNFQQISQVSQVSQASDSVRGTISRSQSKSKSFGDHDPDGNDYAYTLMNDENASGT